MLLESSLMCTALRCMLTIHERVILLAILIGMSESDFNILSLHVNNRIQWINGHIISQKVLQTMSTKYTTTIVHNGQSGVQIGIVTEHFLHNIIMEAIILEERCIWFKVDVSTIFIRRLLCFVALNITLLKRKLTYFTVTEALHLKTRAKSVNRFDTDTIQADTLLKCLRVILTTRIQY